MFPLPFPPLYLVVFLAGLSAGGYGVHTWYKAQMVDAVQAARTVERAGVQAANQADLEYIARLEKEKEAANAKAAKWKTAFDQAANGLRRCAVGPELLGMLNQDRSEPAPRPAAQPEPAPAQAQAGSDCAAVIDTYHWNIENVVEPNRIQIEEMQRFYRELQQEFNRRRGGLFMR